MYEVILTQHALEELESNYDWWAENRSLEQANRWYSGLIGELLTLEKNPERCSLAFEHKVFGMKVHQLNYGLSTRKTHRALFVVQADKVVVLRIRHLAQKELTDLL